MGKKFNVAIGVGAALLIGYAAYALLGKKITTTGGGIDGGLGIPDENVPNAENPGGDEGRVNPAWVAPEKVTPTNPWQTVQDIINWTGITGAVTTESLKAAGYNLPLGSYEDYLKLYPEAGKPGATIEGPEQYYAYTGAYELAALYNPQFAFGAQQAKVALSGGEITPTQYKSYQQQGFINEQGQPLAQRSVLPTVTKQLSTGGTQTGTVIAKSSTGAKIVSYGQFQYAIE